MGAGGNGNIQWEWEGNGNKARLNLGSFIPGSRRDRKETKQMFRMVSIFCRRLLFLLILPKVTKLQPFKTKLC